MHDHAEVKMIFVQSSISHIALLTYNRGGGGGDNIVAKSPGLARNPL